MTAPNSVQALATRRREIGAVADMMSRAHNAARRTVTPEHVAELDVLIDCESAFSDKEHAVEESMLTTPAANAGDVLEKMRVLQAAVCTDGPDWVCRVIGLVVADLERLAAG